MGKGLIRLVLLLATLLLGVSCNNHANEIGPILEQTTTHIVPIRSSKTNKVYSASVTLPKGYNTAQRYPVVYLLHCAGENYSCYMRTMQAVVEQMAELNQMIVVCPEGGVSSWWIDSPMVDTSQFESYIIRDVVPTIDNFYSTISNRKGRFITGVSMGGHGAFYIAIRNSALFSGCGSMIGGMDLTYEPDKFGIATLLGPYEGNKMLWGSHSVVNLVEHLEPGELHLIFDSSLEDFFIQEMFRCITSSMRCKLSINS